MKVKSESEVAQSCLTCSDSMDCSPPGSSIHGIFQARVLEWGAIVTPWTVAYEAPLSMEFSRQEYWSGLPFLSPGDLFDPEIEPCLLYLLHWQVDSLPLGLLVYQASKKEYARS